MIEIIYSKEYLDLIDKARKRGWTKKAANEQGIYVEGHHVIPKCVAPELEKDEDNIVFLTGAEHFIVHKELSNSNPNNDKLSYAFWHMCISPKNKQRDRQYNVSPEDYEMAKIRFADLYSKRVVSEETRKKLSEREVSAETRKKLSDSGKGKILSAETRKKMSDSAKGRIVSDETKKKISDSSKGKSKPEGSGTPPVKVYCLEYPDIIFDSYRDAERKSKELGWSSVNDANIASHIKGKYKYCGKDSSGNKLHWKKLTE